jgi:hypothetical protein
VIGLGWFVTVKSHFWVLRRLNLGNAYRQGVACSAVPACQRLPMHVGVRVIGGGFLLTVGFVADERFALGQGPASSLRVLTG